MTDLDRLSLKKALRVSGLVALLSGLAACGTGATYGTGQTTEQQLLESVSGLVGIAQEEKEPIVYTERAPLVVPGKGKGLETPSQNAETGSVNWPQDPDKLARERRKQQREAEKIAVLSNPNGQDGLTPIDEVTRLRKAGGRGGAINEETLRSHRGASADGPRLLTNKELQQGHRRPESELFGQSNTYDNRTDDEKRAAITGDGERNAVLSPNELAGGSDNKNADGSISYSENSFRTGKRRYLVEPPSKYREPARTETGEIVAPKVPEKKSGGFFSKLNPF
ncbi:hypothetical protein [Coralliovum pocilloporae]|uniref:hypothetical protein n=1 Tax=Coralliovum pocilloporae TaxID=3066369 RepID=UPI0033078985